jgi:ribosome biogenesis GTPase / thiamine phosphate phosphatase
VLSDYGFDERVAASAASVAGEVGRVTRIDRGVYQVVTERGVVRASLAGGLKDAPEPEDRPAIGDWVVMVDEVVEVVLARRSAFRRGDADRLQAQVVAANIDVVFVVHAADEEPNLRRLERELALAFDSGAQPVVVVTKADVAASIGEHLDEFAGSAAGVDVLATSVFDGRGLDALRAYATAGSTVAFIGKSGVGKSSLVNALLGESAQAVGAVRESDGRGRHTTTHRELFVLPGGGVLIDTPGLRSIGMWQSDDGIALAFADVESLASGCRFADCSHEHEPGCAVRDAVDRGDLDEARVANYRSMLAELDDLDRQSELRSRLERKRHAKILSKAVRAMPRKPR